MNIPKKTWGGICAVIFVLMIMVPSFVRPSQATGVEKFGLTFSPTFAEHLGFSSEELFSRILQDLNVSLVRIPVYWTEIERTNDVFTFSLYDALMEKAKEADVSVTLVVGKKVPRWPECHIPSWMTGLSKEEDHTETLEMIETVVSRYKDHPALARWQVENEAFLPFFGVCPPRDTPLMDKEIALVKQLDPHHSILVTDSGELSIWLPAYKRGDVFGTTLYRTVWSRALSPYVGYITYPIPPGFFWLKANVSALFYGEKPLEVSELQAEPWVRGDILEATEKELRDAWTLDDMKETVAYAREVAFPHVYLWGVEWWYYQEKQGDNTWLEYAKTLF